MSWIAANHKKKEDDRSRVDDRQLPNKDEARRIAANSQSCRT
jgi:hypothetical protein